MTGRPETQKDYQERINKVLVYISEHLDEKMELEKLAAKSNFSAYHFHRIMRAYLNEPLGNFINRLRIDKAAGMLEYTSEPLHEIAFRCGYEIPSSFNKAFKKRFGLSPGEYRSGKRQVVMLNKLSLNQKEKTMELKPKIKEIKSKKIIYVSRRGDYNKSAGEAWNAVCDFAAKNRLFGFKTEMIGISHDDPTITETDKLRYDACIVVNKDIEPVGEVGVKNIAAGKYAVFMHKGPYQTLSKTYDNIYKGWLPQSGYKLRDLPCFEKYLNDPEKVKAEKLKTEIYLPVE